MTTFSRRRGSRRRLVVIAATAGVALAGCATEAVPVTAPSPGPATSAAAPATVAPSEQAVQWTDSVCAALVPVVDALDNPPAFDVTAPAATRDAYTGYLGRAQAAADGAVQGVTAAGAAPVEGGDQVAADVRANVTELRDDLAAAHTQLEQTDVNDPNAVGRAVVTAGNLAGALGNSAQTLSALDGDPRLDAAFSQAASCERLRAIRTPGR